MPPQFGSSASFGRCPELLDCRHQWRRKEVKYAFVVSATLPLNV
jgi:hypothetical protein